MPSVLPERMVHVVQAITDQLEGCDGPFERPWAGRSRLPFNALTGKPYSGFNLLALWSAKAAGGYQSDAWATLKQWSKKRCRVPYGARATLAYRPLGQGKGDSADSGFRKIHLFNGDQVNGFLEGHPDFFESVQALPGVDSIMARFGGRVEHRGDRAFYSPSTDTIVMPEAECFTSTSTRDATLGYYGVLAHEYVHWTGHKSRLDRQGGKKFGDPDYAFEELVAELGSAFLLAELGVALTPREDHAIYIKGWLKALRSDPRFLVYAARFAQLATRYLLRVARAQTTGVGEPA